MSRTAPAPKHIQLLTRAVNMILMWPDLASGKQIPGVREDDSTELVLRTSFQEKDDFMDNLVD